MTVAYKTSSGANKQYSSGSTSITCPQAAIALNDLMIIQLSTIDVNVVPGPIPAGWTLLGPAVGGSLVAYRIAGPTEPNGYVFGLGGNDASAAIMMTVYSGQHMTSPIDGTARASKTDIFAGIVTPALTATKLGGRIHRAVDCHNQDQTAVPATPGGTTFRRAFGIASAPAPYSAQMCAGDASQTSLSIPSSNWGTTGSNAFGSSSYGVTTVIRAANEAPSAPAAFTSPTSTTRVATTGTVTHGGSTDINGDTLTYDFDLSVDNGVTWSAKRVKAAGVSFTHDYSALAATNTAKWRSRAWDGTVYGPYTTSVAFKVNRAPAAPVLSAPNGGENYATSMTVSWAAATDPNSDVLSYEVEFSSDGGTTWSVLATDVSLISYTHNASVLPATQTARVRVRANDGLLTGPYDTSEDNFTINRAPTAPTLGAPDDNTVANLRGGYPFSWKHNDVDLQAQALYAFMRTHGTTTQWWDGNAWVSTEFYVASAAGSVNFPAGFWPAGSYTWTVSTMDIFDAKSAYAVARSITSTGGLSMVV